MLWASRKVLAWRLSKTLDASFGIEALEEALTRYGTPEIFNTDQGSQFTVEMLRASGNDPSGKDYLELATGRWPVIPIIFSIAGCRSVTLIDSQRLMDENALTATCKQLLVHVLIKM